MDGRTGDRPHARLPCLATCTCRADRETGGAARVKRAVLRGACGATLLIRPCSPVRMRSGLAAILALVGAAAAVAIACAPPAAHAQDGGATIQALVDGAEAGGTVLVAPGIYANESVVIDKPLTLASDPPGAAVLTGNSSIAIRQGPGGPVAVSGLVFRDLACPAGGPAAVSVAPRSGPAAADPPGVVAIRNNTFEGTCAAAVSAAPADGALGGQSAPASDVDISGNTFRGIGAGAPAGAPPPPAVLLGMPAQALQGTQVADSLVSSNYMFDLRGAAVQASGARGLAVVNNHVEGSGSSAVLVTSNSSGVRIAYNTVIGSAAPAVSAWADSRDVLIMGNRISESAGALSVCAGRCEAGGAAVDGVQPASERPSVRFHHNTLYASNTGSLIAAGAAASDSVDARSNYYPGHDPDPSRLAGNATAMPAGSAPSRIGALLAPTDLPYFDGVVIDAAVIDAAMRFGLGQVESGGNSSLEIVRADVRLAEPLAAVSALAAGRDDARYRPVLASQIDSMRDDIDANGADAAVLSVRALGSSQEHYPFILNRTGHVQANGANPDRFGVVSPIASGDNPVPFERLLADLDAAPAGAAAWYDYRIRNFVHEGQPVESKRSLLSLHDLGTADRSDDLVLGAGYYPKPVGLYVGPSASSSVEAVRGYAGSAGLVLVSPSSLSPDLALPDTVYRMAPNDDVRAPRVAEVMAEGGPRDVVAIVQDDAYGNAAYERIRAEFNRLSTGTVLPKVPFDASIGDGEWGPAMARANAMAVASSAADPGRGAAVLYIGFDPPFAGAAAEALGYPALAGAQWYSTDLAGSSVVTDGGPALDLALSTGLKAVAFGIEPSAATGPVDAAVAARPGGGDAGDPRTGYAYAAHDAVLLLGGALAAGHSTAGAFASNLHALAAAGLPGGSLGEIAFDGNGDLVRPATFSTWEISPDTRKWIVSETAAAGAGAYTLCTASLASDRLDLGSVGPGQAGEPRRQTLSNNGNATIVEIALDATAWSGGLPANATSFMAVPEGGEPGRFAPLAPDASLLGAGAALEPNSSVAIDYMLDLTGIAELPAGASAGPMEQTITYEVACG